MLDFVATTQFKKDYKRIQKRGKKIKKIQQIIEIILSEKELPKKYKDHSLIGNYNGRRECHIEPDWLLIYRVDGECAVFERTGTHSDLFKK